jgi:hypothetical protein
MPNLKQGFKDSRIQGSKKYFPPLELWTPGILRPSFLLSTPHPSSFTFYPILLSPSAIRIFTALQAGNMDATHATTMAVMMSMTIVSCATLNIGKNWLNALLKIPAAGNVRIM